MALILLSASTLLLGSVHAEFDPVANKLARSRRGGPVTAEDALLKLSRYSDYAGRATAVAVASKRTASDDPSSFEPQQLHLSLTGVPSSMQIQV